jgi:hypothetical protein
MAASKVIAITVPGNTNDWHRRAYMSSLTAKKRAKILAAYAKIDWGKLIDDTMAHKGDGSGIVHAGLDLGSPEGDICILPGDPDCSNTTQ